MDQIRRSDQKWEFMGCEVRLKTVALYEGDCGLGRMSVPASLVGQLPNLGSAKAQGHWVFLRPILASMFTLVVRGKQ